MYNIHYKNPKNMMFFKKKFWQEYFTDFSKSEKFFILFAVLTGFSIYVDYSIIRPAINSIYIQNYTAQWIPYSWIVVMPLNFGLVYLYNRILPKWGCLKTFGRICLTVMLMSLVSALYIDKFKYLAFIQCAWKDVYIMLMFKQLWSLIHTSIPMKRAKIMYGLIWGGAGLGAVFGSLVPAFSAVQVGSQNLLLVSIPMYSLIYLFYKKAYKHSALTTNQLHFKEVEDSAVSTKDGFALFKKSKILVYILLIVIFMQLTLSFIDYQFNTLLAAKIPDVDMRTQFTARLMGVINFVSSFSQLLGGFLLVPMIGLKRTHFIIPLILFFHAVPLLFYPFFGIATLAYATSKTMDYSFLGVSKEMLYNPLKMDEKFRAKAIIDVFAYRAARGFGSLLILAITFFFAHSMIILESLAVITLVLWMGCVLILFKEQTYKQVDKASVEESEVS
jgi:AAA family ATP:ADP antiporter